MDSQKVILSAELQKCRIYQIAEITGVMSHETSFSFKVEYVN